MTNSLNNSNKAQKHWKSITLYNSKLVQKHQYHQCVHFVIKNQQKIWIHLLVILYLLIDMIRWWWVNKKLSRKNRVIRNRLGIELLFLLIMRKELNNRVRCWSYRVERYRNWLWGSQRWMPHRWVKLGKIYIMFHIFLINLLILALSVFVNNQKLNFLLNQNAIREEWVDWNLNNFWNKNIWVNFTINLWNQRWEI